MGKNDVPWSKRPRDRIIFFLIRNAMLTSTIDKSVRRRRPLPQERIDPDALRIISRLKRNGHDAYLVGGCVRDLLLGRTPKDFDVATSATPEEIRSLFRNSRIIGRRFRLAHIFFGPKIIETATFRSNPRPMPDPGADQLPDMPTPDDQWCNEPGLDPIQPEPSPPVPMRALGPNDHLLIRRDNVFGTVEEDAKRRDFTINGLYYDPQRKEVIDYVGGLDDLKVRQIRTIGNPDVRFREDPVRILRAIKFAARLDMHIEPATHDAIIRYREQIRYCAPARVAEEIRRFLREGVSRPAMEIALSLSVLDTLADPIAKAMQKAPSAGRLRRRLAAADKAVASGAETTSAVLMANFIIEALDPSWPQAQDPSTALQRTLGPMVTLLHVPKKDADRIRQILLAQRRIVDGGPKRRIRALMNQEAFVESLFLAEISFLAGLGPDRETILEWKHRIGWPEKRIGGPMPTRPARRRTNARRRPSHRPHR